MSPKVAQRPVPQTLCGALQKEPNCKCLVLTVLIYGCLAAVTWCRCANVTKIMVNYTKFPIRSTKHVSSPCDDGYIYIPVAFMGMLYLVYLVECYHSPIRIDLLHAESQDSVLSKLAQLKVAQPRIWWKAVSYHYVRRKRQITRYRNGDNYTTTQVYYERVNTHSATSHYFYDYCGVKDISKELILEPKIPITKIMLTKGFAFSNIRSATEFEEARSRFFAEQELSDDYMEMREGLDLGYNVNTMLVAVLGNPWFTNRYIYWCLSALLLSWPLRVIIEYKTQYADYQVTKLFGVNYDTPTSGEPIHASMSQLSQPGSYMLAPSYSEALLMDPATPRNDGPEQNQENWQAQRRETDVATDMVPSYSEALLYERAEQHDRNNAIVASTVATNVPSDATRPPCTASDPSRQTLSSMPCECHCPCPCHGNANDYELRDERSYVEIAASSELPAGVPPTMPTVASDAFESEIATLRTTADGRLHPPGNVMPHSMDNLQAGASPSKCGSCGRISTSTQTINTDVPPRVVARNKSVGSSQTFTSSADLISGVMYEREHVGPIPRDISEPNLRSRTEPASAFPNGNVRSLENILENEEELTGGSRVGFNVAKRTLPREALPREALPREALPREALPSERLHIPERHRRLPPSLAHHRSFSLDEASVSPRNVSSNGTIPKLEPRSRIMVNPMSNEACWKLPDSRTYFCLKSILKQNRRRYTLVTADEFQNLADQELINQGIECVESPAVGRSEKGPRSRERLNPRRRMPSFEEFMPRDKMYSGYDQKRETTRTLIFASPIQEVFPGDPFRGKNIIPIGNSMEYTGREDFPRPSRSPAIRDAPGRCVPDPYIGERTGRVPVEPFRADNVAFPARIAHPSYRHDRDLRFLLQSRSPTMDANLDVRLRVDETSPLPPPRAYRNDALPPPYGGLLAERAKRWSTSSNEYDDMRSYEGRSADFYTPDRRRQLNPHRLNRPGLRPGSFRERRPKLVHTDRNFRRSFTGRVEDYRVEDDFRRANFSMETSL